MHDLESHGLSGLEGFVTVHLDRRIMGEQIVGFAVFIDESVALGIVEPLDFTACHPYVPLQRTPSLEYHPLHPHTNLAKNLVDCADLYRPRWVLIGCNTVLPIVKVAPSTHGLRLERSTHNLNLSIMMKFFPCMHVARFD
ncbi:hypothetical protein D3C73_1371870 [compost metagenome]